MQRGTNIHRDSHQLPLSLVKTAVVGVLLSFYYSRCDNDGKGEIDMERNAREEIIVINEVISLQSRHGRRFKFTNRKVSCERFVMLSPTVTWDQ